MSISWQQVARHSEIGDCWFVIQGQIYDVSSFMLRHPGGRWILLKYGGKDATQAFLYTIHSEIAMQQMRQLHMGTVSSVNAINNL